MTDRISDESTLFDVFDALEQHLLTHDPHDPHNAIAVDLLLRLRRHVMEFGAKAHEEGVAEADRALPIRGMMDIELVPVSCIDPGPLDPLREAPENSESCERARWASLEQAGQGLMVWNEQTGHLVFGHYRFKLLLEQGASVVEAIVVDMPPDNERAFRAQLRRITGWYG